MKIKKKSKKKNQMQYTHTFTENCYGEEMRRLYYC